MQSRTVLRFGFDPGIDVFEFVVYFDITIFGDEP